MALTVRYFSTTSAGAGDGTTWADRAALFSSGNWSTVITGFDFSANAMEARIGGGGYTCSQTLNVTTITTDPTVANPLILHGCDSSGNRLSPSDPDWTSDLPLFDDTGMPNISTTTNIATIDCANVIARLIKFTASGRTFGAVIDNLTWGDWLEIINSTANSNTSGTGTSLTRLSNSYIGMTGSSYSRALSFGSNRVDNVRLQGVTGSSGNRHGVDFQGASTGAKLNRVTVVGFGGDGLNSSTTNSGHYTELRNCNFISNGGDGIQFHSTASQTTQHIVENCVITGNGGWGLDAGAARVVMANCRARDNASGNFTNFGNYPTDLDNYTTDADDAADFVNSGAGNYQIKSTAGFINRNIGVSQEATSGGGLRRVFSGGAF